MFVNCLEKMNNAKKENPVEKGTVEAVLRDFLRLFISNPYLCYTEHGLHALFYAHLYNALGQESLYFNFKGHIVCALQKEYATAHKLEKAKRQHWDIALIHKPENSDDIDYDMMPLAAVFEFGMNSNLEHLIDDIQRVGHERANADHRYVVHLYRLSEAKTRFSGRDWSSRARDVTKFVKDDRLLRFLEKVSNGSMRPEQIVAFLMEMGMDKAKAKAIVGERGVERPATIYFGLADNATEPAPLPARLYAVSDGRSQLITVNGFETAFAHEVLRRCEKVRTASL